MKLVIPKGFVGSITDADGKAYAPAKDGTVTIPDDKVTDNLWGYGFIVSPVELSAKPAASSINN